MKVYRIVKDRIRTTDLSGSGAFRTGGRWNSKGTYMLYTSENSSLAFLESIIHFGKSDFPPHQYLMHIEVDDATQMYTVAEMEYSQNWLQLECPENKKLGDKWMFDKRYIGICVRSAVNILENSILLNPLFPGYYDLIKVINIMEIRIDERLINYIIHNVSILITISTNNFPIFQIRILLMFIGI